RSAWRDLLMAEELDRIRQVTETMPERVHGEALIPTAYDRAFQEYGLNVAMGDRNDLIRHIAESEIRQQFIVGLDYWAINAPSDALQQRLTAITRAIDPDPWRNRVRTPGVWKDRIALADLAAAAPLTEQPVELLLLLGNRLARASAGTLNGPS